MATDEMDPLHRSIARFDEYAERRRAQEEAPDESDRFAPIEGEHREADKPIIAREFEWTDPSSIQPRQWIYGKHYMRGMVSATAGIGGAGKSTLLNVELVSMAIGRDLLRDGADLPLGPQVVWGHNGEDPYEELQRRIMAVCKHYGVTRENLGGRLRITSGREMPMLMARELEGASMVVATEHAKQIAQQILEHRIQVFIADPFVTVHAVSENDNNLIDKVVGVLRQLAADTNAAVEVAHHFRKLNGDEPTVDALRGASSLVGGARSVRIVASMTKEEATKYALDEDQRGFYSWLQNGKANMLPPTHKRRWLRMESVSLDNAREPYEADEIGVVTGWSPPEIEVALSGPEFRLIRSAILAADPIRSLRADTRSTGWIGYLIATAMQLEPKDQSVKNQMQSVIGKLVANGCLLKDQIHDASKGRSVPVMRWSTEEDSE